MQNNSQFDAVVIGSGFGGSVNAYRLAATGHRVCVLERGRTYGKGDFPRDVQNVPSMLWRYPEHPSYQGLYQLRFFSGLGTVVASGLGGGSLVYANVHVRPDARIFDGRWPREINRATLDPYYGRVARMLNVSPLPSKISLPKLDALERAVGRLAKSSDLFRPDEAVYWGTDDPASDADPYGNGIAQEPCKLVAECEFGCQHQSKNTLDLNYLRHAQTHGAEIRTRAMATSIEQRPGGGYRVWFVDTGSGERSQVSGQRVVVSAGTLGTVELLLRCRDQFRTLPALSERLGCRFSSNGDFLGNVMNTRDLLEPGRGPDVTAVIRYMDQPPYFTMATPTFSQPVMNVLASMGQGNNPILRALGPAIRPWINAVVPSIMRGGLLTRPIHLPWSHTEDAERMTILFAIGQDSGDGRIVLKNRFLRARALDVVWEYEKRNELLIQRMSAAMNDLAGAYGGTFDYAPFWKYLRRTVTVHPLGGCVMADSPAEGVVSPDGEVFGYPGLFVADGSVIPSALGFHPSMTIAAVAERISDAVTQGSAPSHATATS